MYEKAIITFLFSLMLVSSSSTRSSHDSKLSYFFRAGLIAVPIVGTIYAYSKFKTREEKYSALERACNNQENIIKGLLSSLNQTVSTIATLESQLNTQYAINEKQQKTNKDLYTQNNVLSERLKKQEGKGEWVR